MQPNRRSAAGSAAPSAARRPATAAPAQGAIAVVTADPQLVTLLRSAAPDASVLPAASPPALADLLLGHTCAVLVVEVAALGGSAATVLPHLASQFPELPIVAIGTRADEGALSRFISGGQVYRFLHSPVSPERARAFIATARRRHDELRVSVAPAAAAGGGARIRAVRAARPGGSTGHRYGLIAAVVAAIAGVGIASAWLFESEPTRASVAATDEGAVESERSARAPVAAGTARTAVPATSGAMPPTSAPATPAPTMAPPVSLPQPSSPASSSIASSTPPAPRAAASPPARPSATIPSPVPARSANTRPAGNATSGDDERMNELLRAAIDAELRSGPAGSGAGGAPASGTLANSNPNAPHATSLTIAAPTAAPVSAAPASAVIPAPAASNPAATPPIGTSTAAAPAPLRRLSVVPPTYPARARSRGTEGWVDVTFTVDARGVPRDLRVMAAEPTGVFDEAAVAAVAQWRFEPPAAPQDTNVRVRFKLDR